MSTRSMIIWCPDWPVVAAVRSDQALSRSAAIAVVASGSVYACSHTARQAGVRRGMRRRDAASICPEMIMLERAPEQEVAAFSDIVDTIEDCCSAVMPIRPGLCAVGSAKRFYGSEQHAAAMVAERLVNAGVWDCRFGIADDLFTAELAARHSDVQQCRVIEAGGSADFLTGIEVAALATAGIDEADSARARELVGLLRRLGIRRLGDFAALSPRDVLTRFGAEVARWHRMAQGADVRLIASRTPPPATARSVRFEPALHNAQPVVFSSRSAADEVITELDRVGLVCSQVRIEVWGENGGCHTRTWAHPRWFSARDLIDRLHWQLQPRGANPVENLVEGEPVVAVCFIPERTEALGHHAAGLFGAPNSERVEVGISRLQGLLGPDAVLHPVITGGRDPRTRQRLSPWGIADQVPSSRAADLPWPGRIPSPAPSAVFAHPSAAVVADAHRQPISYDERGRLTGQPRWISIGDPGSVVEIAAWAGPWQAIDTWWEPHPKQPVARCQLVAADGRAWLAAVAGEHWSLEARYD